VAAEANTELFYGSDEDVQGKTVTVTFTANEEEHSLQLWVSPPLDTGSFGFEDGALENDGLHLVPGTQKTFEVAVPEWCGNAGYKVEPVWGKDEDIRDYVYFRREAKPKEPAEGEEGNGAEYDNRSLLTVGLLRKKGIGSELAAYPAKLLFKDIRTDMTVNEVNIYADMITSEDFSDLPLDEVVSSDYNSISLYLGDVADVPEGQGFWYDITAWADETDYEPLLKGKEILVPAPANQSVVIRLSDTPNVYRTEELSYTLGVRLVQIADGEEKSFLNAAEADKGGYLTHSGYLESPKQMTVNIKLKDAEAIEEEEATLQTNTYATKLTLTKTNAAKKQYKKIYTGMEPFDYVKVGYIADKKKQASVKELDHVDLCHAKGGEVAKSTLSDDRAIMVIQDENGDDAWIRIDPSAIPAGKYDLVAYAKELNGMEVKAKTSVTILQGIESLKVTTPSDTIYKAPKKAASLTATAVYDPVKPAVKKVKWYLVNPDYDPASGIPGEEDLFTELGKKEISVKNGKVTIAKGVKITEDLEFAIAAVPADYAHSDRNNGIAVSRAIRITNKTSKPAHIYIGSENSYTEITQGAKYLAAELDGSTFGSAKSSFLGSNVILVTDEDDVRMENVTLKADGLTFKNGLLRCTKETKKASLEAVTTDGSKGSFKVNFSVVSDTSPTLSLYTCEAGTDFEDFYMHVLAQSMHMGFYTSNAPKKLTITDGKAVNDTMDSLYFRVVGANSSMVSHSLKIKGGKIANPKEISVKIGSYYEIVPTARETVLTFTEKSTGKKTVITVTNPKISTAKKATLKLKASNFYDGVNGKAKDNKGKVFSDLFFASREEYENAGSYNKVTYTVMKGKKPLPAKTTVAIRITKDAGNDSSGSPSYPKSLIEYGLASLSKDENGNYIAVLDETGSFSIDYMANFDGCMALPEGKYAFTVTPLDDEGYASAKPVTVNVTSSPAPKAKAALKTAKFAKFGEKQYLEFGKLENVIFKEGAAGGQAEFGSEPDLLGLNTKGRINNFANCFELGSDEEGTFLRLKRDLTAADGYTGKKGKESITGYVGYTYRQLNGDWDVGYLKVTVQGAKTDR
nr:hypothetical protein [Lachnospiraceae bacterium]